MQTAASRQLLRRCSDTVASGARVVLLDERLRGQLLQALLEDNRLHMEAARVATWSSRLFIFAPG